MCLLSVSDLDFAQEYTALLPQNFSGAARPLGQLVGVLLGGDLGNTISELLMSLPSTGITKES